MAKKTNNKKKPSGTKKRGFWSWIKRTFLMLFLSHLAYVVLLKWIEPPITITQVVALANSLNSEYTFKRDYVNGDEMGANAKLAVIASEDQLFADHNGFDWKSIEKAMAYNKRKPNRVRGASTISQQTAKNVFLWQGRSFFRKGLEVYNTFLIEWIWGKKRILEVYLNVIEMGEGIYGIEAAAQQYFKKPAKQLTQKEAAMIAACLPNPVKFTVKPVSNRVRGKYPWIMRQMSNLAADPDIKALIQTKTTAEKKSKRTSERGK